MSKMWPKGPRSRVELLKAGASFLTVLIPVLEKWQAVLPVSPQVRQQCLVIAVCVCVLAVIAGYSTGRHTPNGLWVGWCFLLLFLALLTAQLADLQRLEWAERPSVRPGVRLLQPIHIGLPGVQCPQASDVARIVGREFHALTRIAAGSGPPRFVVSSESRFVSLVNWSRGRQDC